MTNLNLEYEEALDRYRVKQREALAELRNVGRIKKQINDEKKETKNARNSNR